MHSQICILEMKTRRKFIQYARCRGVLATLTMVGAMMFVLSSPGVLSQLSKFILQSTFLNKLSAWHRGHARAMSVALAHCVLYRPSPLVVVWVQDTLGASEHLGARSHTLRHWASQC